MFTRILAAIAVLSLTACQRRRLLPVDIEAHDMCEFCRMAISEKKFAVELIDAESDARKFDNLGCMVSYVKKRGGQGREAAIFVADYATQEWIEAKHAHYVESEHVRGPMGVHIAAWKTLAGAQAVTARYGGRTLSFEDLWQ